MKELSNFHSDKSRPDGLDHKCKECKRIYGRTEKRKIYTKCWNAKNKLRKLTKQYEYRKNKILLDPGFKLRLRISSLIGNSLKAKGLRKRNRSWEATVGYTLNELKIHLQSKFTEGMHWNNYGKWHIDHIKLICSFNIKAIDDYQFKECWALKNLQPLWAIDNMKKISSDKKLSINNLMKGAK